MNGFVHPQKPPSNFIELKSQDEINPNDNLMVLTKMLNEFKDEKSIKEIQEAINFHKEIQSMTIPQFNIIREKRQVSSTNCSALNIQLVKLNAQILEIQQKITTNTELLESFNQKIINFQIEVNTKTGIIKTLYEKLLKTYTSLSNSLKVNLNQLKEQLRTLQVQENLIKSKIQTYCPTTTTSSK